MASQEAQRSAPPVVEVEFVPPGVAIVTLRGEHDLSSRQLLTEALAAASARSNVLVNLCECTFIDSAIVHALLLAGTRLHACGGRIELVIPPDAWAVQRVAELTPLAATLPIHETRSAGIAGFRTGRHSIQIKDSRRAIQRLTPQSAHAAGVVSNAPGEQLGGRRGETASSTPIAEHSPQNRFAAPHTHSMQRATPRAYSRPRPGETLK